MATHSDRQTFNTPSGSPSSYSHTVDCGTGSGRVLLVAVRHGSATSGITHSTPTIDDGGGAQNLVQVASEQDARSGNDNRRMTLWKFVDPPEGNVTLAGSFSSSVAQCTVTAVVADDADDTGAVATTEVGSGSTISQEITPTDADSLLYLFAMTDTGFDDPFTPTDITEVEDSDDHGTVSNHSFTTGYRAAAGTAAEDLTTEASAANEWAAIAVEVLPAPSGGVAHDDELTDGADAEDDMVTLLTTGRDLGPDEVAAEDAGLTRETEAARAVTDDAGAVDTDPTRVTEAERDATDAAAATDSLSYDHTSASGTDWTRDMTDEADGRDSGEWVMPNTVTPYTAAIVDSIAVAQGHVRELTDFAEAEDSGFGGLNEDGDGTGDVAGAVDELTYVLTPGADPGADDHTAALTDQAGAADELTYTHLEDRLVAGRTETDHEEPSQETEHREGTI